MLTVVSFQTCMTYFLLWRRKEDIFHVQAALLHTTEIVQNVERCYVHTLYIYLHQPMTFDFVDAKLGMTS